MMEIIPVLDLMQGYAVSGQSGNRDKYTPLKTIYSSSSDPISITRALKENGARRIYIADLDMIEKKGSNLDLINKINHLLPVTLDCGLPHLESFEFALDFAYQLIIATETLESLEELDKIIHKFPTSRLVLSVDIKDGELYAPKLNIDLDAFQDKIRELNLPEIILLNLSQVGTQKGYDMNLLEKFTDFKQSLILGGGITPDDLRKISQYGINKVLVGSALHKGLISLR